MTNILDYFCGFTDETLERAEKDPEFKKELEIRETLKNDFSEYLQAQENLYGEDMVHRSMLTICTRYLIMYVVENGDIEGLNALRSYFNDTFDQAYIMMAQKKSFKYFKKAMEDNGGMSKLIESVIASLKNTKH